MKKFNSGPTRLRRAIGNLLTQRRILPILAVAAGLLPVTTYGAILNFTDVSPPPGTPGYNGFGVINGAVYNTANTLPAGTGVFDPFLTYQHKGTEEGVN